MNSNKTLNEGVSESVTRISNQNSLSRFQVMENPLTLSARCSGLSDRGYSWHLSVNAAGEGVLFVHTVPNRTMRKLKIEPEQFRILREEIFEEDFFSLENNIGESIPSSGKRSVSITIGHTTKSIHINFLQTERTLDNLEAYNQASRAIRVQMIIRSWFDDPNAFDFRSHDERFLSKGK